MLARENALRGSLGNGSWHTVQRVILSERVMVGALGVAAVDSGYLTWRYLALRLDFVAPGSSICSWSRYVDCDLVLLTPQANAFYVPNGLLGFAFYIGCIVWWIVGNQLGPAYRRHVTRTLAFWLAVAVVVTLRFFWLLVQLPVFCPLCPLNHLATYIASGASLFIFRKTPESGGQTKPYVLFALVVSCVAIFIGLQAIWLAADAKGLLRVPRHPASSKPAIGRPRPNSPQKPTSR